ncbi:DNA-protecting protein DprA [Pseudolysobacter antarcticus]|uniref:DNA-protecting protein DprA n=1 Tax=Pseudolysobacter antarcticus TaxID=2511995 RepID=A0A411HPR3_9GAMM|nr:DNA-processing protein DprA [Pseudolysobacter antarcticus]QBB72465.1 DNA-protecting protein DprA [Pseudolysobacter antarcticus]
MDAQSIDNATAWLTLMRAPSLGAATLRGLIERFGDSRKALRGILASPATSGVAQPALVALRQPDENLLATDLAWLEQPEHHFIGWDSEDYPALLRRIPSPPAGLFVNGNADLLWMPQVAIVGSRSSSESGLSTARSFAKALVQAGFAITSGLADGIDGAAHVSALDAGGTTLAVLGTGVDLVYPRKHHELARRIAAHGALVSEFLPGTPGRAENFPRRNRIIAGLSLGTLVIEASVQSGSLITARLAAEQGREVFAIPGSIHNPLARGCHQLIRQGAKLVETADEVIEELGALAQTLSDALRSRLSPRGNPDAPSSRATLADPHAHDPDYARLLAALGHETLSLDILSERSGLTVAALSSMLLLLELEGTVVAARGGMYARSGR